MLINLKTVDWPELKEDRAKRIVHSEPGAVVAEVGWNGRGILVGSVYAPAKPTPRLAFLQNMRKWASEDMYLGGDWNCVPDVTVDVQSSDPLRYRNTGGALLEDVTGDIGLMDFRRTQLGEAHEHTRMPLGVVHTKEGDDVVLTRLDRFYVPPTRRTRTSCCRSSCAGT